MRKSSGMKSGIARKHRKGAYLLYLEVDRPLTLRVGMLGDSFLPAGRYIYVGSASGGIDQRVSRHRRLAAQKNAKTHWHIDSLLVHPGVRLTGSKALKKSRECEISRKVASRRGTTVPVPDFGSTDCTAGCKAHLYRIDMRTLRDRAKRNSSLASSANGTGGPAGSQTYIGEENQSWTKRQSSFIAKEKKGSSMLLN
jgi:Uri superfamily endonuclease